MNYSIIDSVKGGSGKTCFSLNHALYLSNLNVSDGRIPSLYIDVDFSGTSLETALFANPKIGTGLKEPIDDPLGFKTLKLAKKHFNSILDCEILYNELITKLEFYLKTIVSTKPVNIPIDLIISSPDYKQKQRFHGTKSNEVNISNFKYKLCCLMKKIPKTHTAGYKNIVMDMPPGGDRYASSVYDILLSLNGDNRHIINWNDKDSKVNVFHMTTYDIAHIYATLEHVCNFYNDSNRKKLPTNIFIVVNDIFNTDDSTNSFGKRLAHSIILEEIQKNYSSLPQVVMDKLYFIIFPFNEKYQVAMDYTFRFTKFPSLSMNCLDIEQIYSTYASNDSDGMVYKYYDIAKAKESDTCSAISPLGKDAIEQLFK